MSLHEGAKKRFRMDSVLSNHFEVKEGMHQSFVMSPFPLEAMANVVNEFAEEGALSQLLYADNVFMICETINRLRNKCLKWKVIF